MPPDAYPQSGHAESAGWVLRALDPEETKRFEEHLRSCGGCQRAVAEFEPVARVLQHPAPAVEPPPDLQARTLASVQRAAVAARPARTRGKMPAWWPWRWNVRLLALASAVGGVAVVATAVIFLHVRQAAAPAPAETVAIPLQPPSGGTASGLAAARPGAGGSWTIALSVHGLKDLGPNRFYECWYAGPANSHGHPQLISAGTFTVGRSGSGSFTMTSAADPYKFGTMQITAQRPGRAGQTRPVLLAGRPHGS